MAIAYRTKLETDNTTATRSPVINKPAGAVDGDLLLMYLVTNTIVTPADGPINGWAKVTSQNAASDATTTLWWKICSVSDGSSWTMTNIFDVTARVDAVVVAYSGTETVSPIHTYASATTTSTAISGPSITTTVDNCMILLFAGTDPTTASYTGTPDASPVATERHDAKNSGGGSYEYLYVEEYKQATRGAIALDVTGLTSDSYGHIQVAIREPAPTLTVNDGYSLDVLDEPVLVPVPKLTVSDGYSLSIADTIVTTKNASLVGLADTYSTSQSDAVVVEAATIHILTMQDAYSTSLVDGIAFFGQMLSPAYDTYDGNWTNEFGNASDLFTSLNEADPSDTDYIQSEWNPEESPVVVKLSAGVHPNRHDGHVLRYRVEKYPVITKNIKLVVQLRQDYVDETSMGTLIAEWIDSDLSSTITTVERTLTEGEAENITDHTSLYVRITAGTVELDVSSCSSITTVDSDLSVSRCYYVDTALGNNSNLGTIDSPWLTINYAVSQLVASNTLYIRGGTYRETAIITTSGTAGSPITIKGYPGETAIICGADVLPTWTNHAGDVWKAEVAADPKVVIFDGVVGNSVAALVNVDSEYDYFWSVDTLYVYSSGGDPNTVYTNPGVEAGVRGNAIWTNNVLYKHYINLEDITIYGTNSMSITSKDSSYWNYTNVTINKSAANGITGYGARYHTVTNCTLIGERNIPVTATSGITFSSYGDYPSYYNSVTYCTINYWSGNATSFSGRNSSERAHHNEVSNCNLDHCCCGMYLTFVDNTIFHDNSCDDENKGAVTTVEAYGIAVRSSSNNTIYNNQFTNGLVASEIWAWTGAGWPNDGPSDNNEFHHNIFAGNSLYGFYIYTGNCDNTQVYCNLMYDNARAGIFIKDDNVGYESTGCTLYNNSCYGNNTEGGYADIYIGSVLAGWTIKNNIFCTDNQYCMRVNAVPSFTHTNNCYYKSSGDVITITGTTYDLAHVTDFEATAIAANPKYDNPATDDYDIQSDSPCINAGVDVGLTTDYEGNPIVGNPDIGAYEYTA